MWRRRIRAGLVATVLVLLPFVALAGGLGIAALMAVLGIATAALAVASTSGRRRPGEWFAALLAFALWAALSTLWSTYPLPGGLAVLGATPFKIVFGVVAFTVAAGAVVHSARRSSVFGQIAVAGVVLLLALALVDLVSGYGLSQFVDPPGDDLQLRLEDARKNVGRGVVVATVLLPATALAVWRMLRHDIGDWPAASASLLLVLATAVAGHLSGQWVVVPALLAAACAGVVAWRFPRGGTLTAFGAAGASLALAPVLGRVGGSLSSDQKAALPFSAEHRAEMWSYTTARIGEAPLFGHGFGASRAFDATANIRGFDMPLLGLHPHNIGLQLWLETGAVGVALALAALGALAFRAADWVEKDPARAAAVSGLVAVAAVVGALSFGVWQEWWWALLFLAGALLAVHFPEREA